ncbi:MAG: hypothetical protein LBI04_05295 [Treponema sp.]|jgi:hypothetical protein|nr:hypothetical protein [Treponema sp.]
MEPLQQKDDVKKRSKKVYTYIILSKKYLGILFFLCFFSFALNSQENNPSYFGHRVTVGNYNSFWEDDIGIIEAGYDFVFNFLFITPEYNILDFGIGLSGLLAFDKLGNPRQPVLGLGLNGSMRIYTPALRKTRIFLEGIMSLVTYTKEFPENGTIVNGGWHLGGGIEYNIENSTKLFAKILWFHTSNNDVYGRERNPSLNAVGIAAGIQL